MSSEPITLDGELEDPETWRRIEERLGALEAPPLVVVGSDSDSANLQSALFARRSWPDCKSFVRFQSHSVFAEALARRHRFVVLGVDTMLVHALAEQQQAWFPNRG